MSAHLLPQQYVGNAQALAHKWSRPEALRYTTWLATQHYENFHVVSVLLPKRLHQDFYNVYSFCRWADDLADEIPDKNESLRLLAWWRAQLLRMYSGDAEHPVFIALLDTVKRHSLPDQPFLDLISAFVQDQTVTRYETWDDVYAYCRRSANPVGRLLLYLCGYSDAERQELSDYTCTALQLANFWQDVSVDLEKGRIYIPLEVVDRHGYSVDDLLRRKETPACQAVIRDVVHTTLDLFRLGLPLIGKVDRRLALDIDLFRRGGMRVLDKIKQQDYRVLHRRPAISKSERLMLLLGSLARVAFTRAA